MIRAFVCDFFRYKGAEIIEEEDILTVRLPPELADYFERKELRLSFRAEAADEESELVTRGSHLFDKIVRYLENEGERLYFRYLPRLSFDKRARDAYIAEHFTFVNCRPHSFKVRRIQRREVIFNFKVRYLSDEKEEQLVSLRATEDGSIERLPSGLLPAEAIEFFPKKPPGAFTNREIRKHFSRCVERISQIARQEATELETAILERLEANVERLQRYYHQLIDELPPVTEANAPRRRKEITRLEEEFRLKLREEIDNHRLQVEIRLVSYAVGLVPLLRTKVFLDTQRRSQFSLHLNLYDGRATVSPCAVCGRPLQRIALCDANHVVCEDCSAPCHECGKLFCGHCPLRRCNACNRMLCAACSALCSACGEVVCTEHRRICRHCDAPVCHGCHRVCISCEGEVCAIHAEACRVCGGEVCQDCSETCALCSERFCPADGGTCRICGRILCQACTRPCRVCGEETCLDHGATCHLPACEHFLCEPDQARCMVCDEPFCPEHVVHCLACRSPLCTGHQIECNACGRPFCPDDTIRCAICGEEVCSACHDGKCCRVCRALSRREGKQRSRTLQEVRKRGLIGNSSDLVWFHHTGHTREIFFGIPTQRGAIEVLVTDKNLKFIRHVRRSRTDLG